MTSGVVIFVLAACSLYGVADDAISRRIGTPDSGTALLRFVDYPQNGGNGRFVANTNFWLKGVDFSCVSPWNSAGGRLRAGTAISKRHVVFANHFPLWHGVRMEFVDANGDVCPCRIEKTKQIGTTDIMIASLDYELTPGIRPAQILPENYRRYIGDGAGWPVVTFTQDEKASLTRLNSIPTNRVFSIRVGKKKPDGSYPMRDLPSRIGSSIPTNLTERAYHVNIVGGDSGNPIFMLIGEHPVLLACLQGGGCGSGPPLHLYRREIQAAMDELCPGYRLEEFDFNQMSSTGCCPVKR